jgi:acetyl esterase/lipase
VGGSTAIWAKRLGGRIGLAVALVAVSCLAAFAAPTLMGWSDLLARPHPHADARLSYGGAAQQVVDVWRPAGKGPFPVVFMIHGGCWNSKVANLTIMDYAADDLRRRGVAVWNIDYRGYDVAGGGYPGTYQDVAMAARLLVKHAGREGLDLDRLVVLGHSAGGHLAVWLAGKGAIHGGPLAGPSGLHPKAVLVLGGLPDLATAADGCGPKSVAAMTGPASAARPDPLSDTSGAALLPLGIPQIVINAADDGIAPPTVGQAWAAKAAASGDRVTRLVPAGGHVEEIAPGSAAWDGAAERVAGVLVSGPQAGVRP